MQPRCRFPPATSPVPVSSKRQGLPWRRSKVFLPAYSKGLHGASSSCRDNWVSVRGTGLLRWWSLNCVHFPYTFVLRLFLVLSENRKMLSVSPFFSSVSDAKLSLTRSGPMGNKWGKCTKRKCAIPLCVSGIAHGYNENIFCRMGKRRAAMGCYSAVLHFRWPCRWLYGNSGSLLSPLCRRHRCGVCHSRTWICRNASGTLPPKVCRVHAA